MNLLSQSMVSSAVSVIGPALAKIRAQSVVLDEDSNLTLESFLMTLNLKIPDWRNPDCDNIDLIEEIDALDLFQAFKILVNECGMVGLENFYLIDFLQTNDPKLLLGFKDIRASTFANQARAGNMRSTHTQSQTQSQLISRSIFTRSIHTLESRKASDYKVNYRTRTQMATKSLAKLEQSLATYEKGAIKIIKSLRSEVEASRIMADETNATAENFRLHFLTTEQSLRFLAHGSEEDLMRKMEEFMKNWRKNARGLLAKMRVRINACNESCVRLRNDLLVKSDLHAMLSIADFQMLILKRDALLETLEVKYTDLAGLKGVTGKASMAMTDEKQIMANLEIEGKYLLDRQAEVSRGINKLDREINYVQDTINRDLKTLEQLKFHLQRYTAPTVNQYILKKDHLISLEKEEKMLERKINILNMKVSNMHKKCKIMAYEAYGSI